MFTGISREKGRLKKKKKEKLNQAEILELENKISEMNLLNRPTIWLDTIGENISEFEDTEMETRQTKAPRDKKNAHKKMNNEQIL